MLCSCGQVSIILPLLALTTATFPDCQIRNLESSSSVFSFIKLLKCRLASLLSTHPLSQLLCLDSYQGPQLLPPWSTCLSHPAPRGLTHSQTTTSVRSFYRSLAPPAQLCPDSTALSEPHVERTKAGVGRHQAPAIAVTLGHGLLAEEQVKKLRVSNLENGRLNI